MNKFVNILLLIITIPIIAYSIFIGFDLPIELLKISGANAPFKEITFYGFAALLLIIFANRSIKRWMGIKMVNQINRFQWNEVISRNRSKQVLLYLILEACVQLFVAFSLYQVTSFSWPVSVVLIIFSLDHLILAFLGYFKNKFRVGITSKAILIADRETKALYFSGLKEVDLQQQSLFFDYKGGLQLSFSSDSIENDVRENFKKTIENNVDRSKVFFSERFKSF